MVSIYWNSSKTYEIWLNRHKFASDVAIKSSIMLFLLKNPETLNEASTTMRIRKNGNPVLVQIWFNVQEFPETDQFDLNITIFRAHTLG